MVASLASPPYPEDLALAYLSMQVFPTYPAPHQEKEGAMPFVSPYHDLSSVPLKAPRSWSGNTILPETGNVCATHEGLKKGYSKLAYKGWRSECLRLQGAGIFQRHLFLHSQWAVAGKPRLRLSLVAS